MFTQYKLPALAYAFVIHSTALALGIYNGGASYLLAMPLSTFELGFVVLCFIRLFFASVRDTTTNKKWRKRFQWLVYPNGVASTVYYYIAVSLFIYRTLIFNEFDDCLLASCYPSREQSFISLAGTAIVFVVMDKERPMKLPKHHKHHKHKGKHHKHHKHHKGKHHKHHKDKSVPPQVGFRLNPTQLRQRNVKRLNLTGKQEVPRLRLV